jgi:hypothetical protein
MAKYNKTQVQYIYERLSKEVHGEYVLKEALKKKYAPKKPAGLLKYEEALKEATIRAGKEASERYAKQRDYLQKVKDSLVLADSEFDLEKAIKELQSI